MTFKTKLLIFITAYPKTLFLATLFLDLAFVMLMANAISTIKLQDKVVASFNKETKVPFNTDTTWACYLPENSKDMICLDYITTIRDILRQNNKGISL